MANDRFQVGSGNLWDTNISRNMYTSGTSPALVPTTLNSIASFRWPLDMNREKDDHGNFNFRGLIQEFDSGDNFRRDVMPSGASSEVFLSNDFKQISSQASSNDSTTSQSLSGCLQVDNSSAAAYSHLLTGSQQANHPMNYLYSSSGGRRAADTADLDSNHFHFANNAVCWNASAPRAALPDARTGFFTTLHDQVSTNSSFDDQKLKILSETHDSRARSIKKNTAENKRLRNEISTPLHAPKVKKERMGDRVAALQQLVSPFGKTDTASVLSETTEYIKFLHQQLDVFTSPYIKNGAQMQHQEGSNKSKNVQGLHQDLRSRGLCLVPVSSTFPVTHETSIDFWTPSSFGGTYRS